MARFKVLGMKRWRGTLDGKSIDSAKLFVDVRLDDTRNSAESFAKGVATEEIRLPGGRYLEPLEGYPLPFYVDVSTERVSNGKTSREVVTGVRYSPNQEADSDGVIGAPAPAPAVVPARPKAA